MKTILITGGTGLVGKKLVAELLANGYAVNLLTRSEKENKTNINYFLWDYKNNAIDETCFNNISGIIHLAGEGIADKNWTDKRKQEIISSRADTAKLLLQKVKEKNIQLDFYISASATGYYGGKTLNKIFTEKDFYAVDFMGECCHLWEKSADAFSMFAKRIVKIRIGVVLDNDGGALPKIVAPVRLGLGAALGSGKQFMPWIHVKDLVEVFSTVVQNEKYNGVYNAVAPEFVTNHEFTKAAAHVLHKPFFLPNVPAFSLKLILGEMSCVVLEGNRVSSEKISQEGFVFQFPTIDLALEDLLLK
ncbi:MAG: TIGR01777 family oxidoreductase [Bacteroidota bacterium]